MIRLWHRIGVFRMLAVAVLVLGVVGGVSLSAARQSHQRVLQAAESTQSTNDEQRELRLIAAERQRVSAASRSAQREAQSKADAAASQAAEQARLADEAAKKAQQQQPKKDPTKAAPAFGPIPASCGAYTGNVAIGCTLLLRAGFGLDQMPCLKNIWMKESGWRVNAANPSGAYGIAQALPGSKMKAVGADWQTNPATQILWGLDYIKSRYKTPCGAWTNWLSKGWY
ncbi:MAG: hypothetical protein QOI74_618 [Micromonosporaceae bacterium]|nr:hypothetical protein [Micromonosporaceae bacterium]